MNQKKSVTFIGVSLFLIIIVLAILYFFVFSKIDSVTKVDLAKKSNGEKVTVATETKNTEKVSKEKISVNKIKTERLSKKQIKILWSDKLDNKVEKYIVRKVDYKNNRKVGKWKIVSTIESDDILDGNYNSIVDIVDEEPRFYKYKVDVIPKEQYQQTDGTETLAGNVMVCIDPGHFAGKNQSPAEASYYYSEGDYTIKIGKQLKKELKKYGISSYLTRKSGNISLHGYTNEKLDYTKISLRGEYAGENDSNLFISLHTNANLDNANGIDTWNQPKSINKTFVFVNTVAMADSGFVNMANAVGENVTKINYQLGLCCSVNFSKVSEKSISQWSDAINDSLNSNGTVLKRTEDGEDYYGVLRGAAQVGVPGFIVEHAFHTNADMRKEAMDDNMAKLWAKAEAYGIAYGFGVAGNMKMK